jgi:hypothetical protein
MIVESCKTTYESRRSVLGARHSARAIAIQTVGNDNAHEFMLLAASESGITGRLCGKNMRRLCRGVERGLGASGLAQHTTAI